MRCFFFFFFLSFTGSTRAPVREARRVDAMGGAPKDRRQSTTGDIRVDRPRGGNLDAAGESNRLNDIRASGTLS